MCDSFAASVSVDRIKHQNEFIGYKPRAAGSVGMKADQIVAIFEEMSERSLVQGVSEEDACRSYAECVARMWRDLTDEHRIILTAAGSVLWRKNLLRG
jgi:hypothetical protein